MKIKLGNTKNNIVCMSNKWYRNAKEYGLLKVLRTKYSAVLWSLTTKLTSGDVTFLYNPIKLGESHYTFELLPRRVEGAMPLVNMKIVTHLRLSNQYGIIWIPLSHSMNPIKGINPAITVDHLSLPLEWCAEKELRLDTDPYIDALIKEGILW